MASGLEQFSTPSHNTRSSIRSADSLRSVGDPTTFLPFSLNLTPTVADRLCAGGEDQLQDSSTQRVLADESISTDSNEAGSECIDPETNVEQQLHADREVCGRTEHQAGPPNTQSQSCTSVRRTHGPINCDKLNSQQSSVDRSLSQGNNSVTGCLDELTAEKQTEFHETTSSSEDQSTRNNQVENRAATGTPSFDHSQNETQEKPAQISISLQPCNKTEAVESPARNKRAPCPFEDPSDPSMNLSKHRRVEHKSTCGPYGSQLALKSPASVNCSFITSHPSSPAPASSPVLPSLGITPRFPLTSSPAAPSFILPPSHSPSTQAPSPPYPSLTCLPPSVPPLSTCSHIQESSELPPGSDPCPAVQPAACPNASSVQLHEAPTAEEPAEWCAVRRTHTLKVKQNTF